MADEIREDQLSHYSVFNRLEVVSVHDFDPVGIFPEMHTALLDTFECDTGPVHLRESVGIIGIYTEGGFDFPAKILGMGFGADDGFFYF